MSNLKLESIPIFPSRIVEGLAIDVEKAGGSYTVLVDYANLAAVSPYVAGNMDYVLVWDSLANNYFLVPAASLTEGPYLLGTDGAYLLGADGAYLLGSSS